MLDPNFLRNSFAATSWFWAIPFVSAISQINVGHNDLTYESGGWELTHPHFVCGGSVRYTTGAPGAQLSLTFQGTGLDLYFPRAPEGALIEVDIDGEKTELDTKARTYDCNTPIYVVSDLPFDNHTVRVKTLDNKTLYVSKIVYSLPDPITIIDLPSPTDSPSTTEGTLQSRNKLPIIFGIAAGLCAILLAASVWAFLRHRRARQALDKGRYAEVGDSSIMKSAVDYEDDTSSVSKLIRAPWQKFT